MNILDTISKKQNKLYIVKHLKKDEVLFHENDLCQNIGIVIKGQISIVTYLDNGDEIIFNTIKDNQIFGNNLIFSSSPHYKGNIISNISSEVALINKENLIYLLKHNEQFLIEYLKIQSDFGKTLNDKIKLLSTNSAQERLYYYLHENNNSITYNSISDLAKQLYLKRETLSRLISKLVKQKRIKKENKTLSII